MDWLANLSIVCLVSYVVVAVGVMVSWLSQSKWNAWPGLIAEALFWPISLTIHMLRMPPFPPPMPGIKYSGRICQVCHNPFEPIDSMATLCSGCAYMARQAVLKPKCNFPDSEYIKSNDSEYIESNERRVEL